MVRLQSLFGLNTVDHSFQFLKGTSKKANTFLSKNVLTLFVLDWFSSIHFLMPLEVYVRIELVKS